MSNKHDYKKQKKFKQGIGIAEKSQETKRDRWGGDVNHPSNHFLFLGFFFFQ